MILFSKNSIALLPSIFNTILVGGFSTEKDTVIIHFCPLKGFAWFLDRTVLRTLLFFRESRKDARDCLCSGFRWQRMFHCCCCCCQRQSLSVREVLEQEHLQLASSLGRTVIPTTLVLLLLRSSPVHVDSLPRCWGNWVSLRRSSQLDPSYY